MAKSNREPWRPRGATVLLFLAALPWAGCVGKVPVRPEAVKPPEPHLQGVWENPGRGGNPKRMIFESGGRLTFQGGLEFFNPGHWEYHPDLQELRITLPEAQDEKLQIFKLYVGDGLKAFDRAQKQITYHFDDETWSLNVGGWVYSKAAERSVDTEPEPALK
jgi:hypothetical protein